MPKVLITSIAEKIPHLRALEDAAKKAGDWDIIAADCNPECLGARLAKEFWAMNRLDQYTPDRLIEECKCRDIQAIIPTRAGDLDYFSQNKDVFYSKGIAIHVSDFPCIEYCTSKKKFYSEAKAELKSLLIPVLNEDSLKKQELYVVKENTGAGSIGLGIQLTAIDARAHAQSLKEPIFQPYISGREFSADSYVNRNGECMGVVLRWRDLVVDGESQVSTIFKDSELENQIARFVEKIGSYGHCCTQGIIDERGKLHLIETNPRIGGASTLSLKAGLDSFYWFLEEASGKNLYADRENLRIENIRLIRHKADSYTHG